MRDIKCAVCYWISEGKSLEEIQKESWEEFVVCKKHKKEKKMAQCACGNQELQYKTGISKKTGKKWRGYKCEPCDLMMGMDGTPWGQPKNNTNTTNPSSPTIPTSNLEKKIDEILAILRKTNQESPF